MKVLLIAFFDWQGVVYHEFTPNCQTISKEYYLDVLRRLREAIRRKWPILWRSNSWMLEKHGTVTVPQPPYSPDLAPADYFLFPKLKMRLKGRRFKVIKNIKKESLKDLNAIPKSAYEKCLIKIIMIIKSVRSKNTKKEHLIELTIMKSQRTYYDPR